MKKIGWIAISLIGAALIVWWLASIGTEEFSEAPSQMSQEIKEAVDGMTDYTVLVYMNGSDLESDYDEESGEYSGAATTDILEMTEGLTSDRVHLVLETGGTKGWANEQVSSEENQRWIVENGKLVLVESLGAKNMGASDTLTDFVTWGVENYPADKYALVFWNHGGGAVLGFGADELFDNDSLTLDEIEAGLSKAYEQSETQLELIGFDACLMATVETAYKLSPYGRYMIASEELEPGHGWNYQAIMTALSSESSMDGSQLGRIIADSYKLHAEEYEQDMSITLSVMDMSKMASVVQALENFVEEAHSDIAVNSKNFYSFANSRSRAEDYGSASAHGGTTDMVDLMALVRNVSDTYPASAQALESALKEAVVYNLNSVGRPAASGLSIYFPHKDKENFTENLKSYSTIGFSDIYTDFLHTYVERLQGNSAKVELVDNSDFTFSYNDNEDESAPYQVYVNPDDMERIEQIYAVVAMLVEGSDSEMLYLGYDHYVDVDWEKGILSDDFTGEWLMWDENFVTLDLISQGEDYIRYGIPVKLNGQEMDVLVHYDIESDQFEVLGAWKGISEETGMPDKNLIKLKQGDEIIPQFYYYDEATDEDGYIDGDPFTVGDGIDLAYGSLPDGSYLYGFSLTDYSGNETLTDFVEIVLEE
ncbi:hypothetical protein PAECIP111893_00142 [Paenibacillus plantiphilus]|uniref:Peptidase C11 clostripain n=1 Tax=Paenibacillus plantiphilus TaxID=2905650 RepID=A0ABM9BPI1_9BACL|nr:clostripain-related cysteine peptidase [Paenibacillus plantiphilus]CAH1190059.1 hypothetical protein PAECIP111893_00142 [Paenibacillus plantiphilus]